MSINLVTGATGILGSHLVAELVKQGENVIACRQAKSSTEAIQKVFALYFQDWESQYDKVRWRELDVLNLLSIEEALADVDSVYHCAAHVSMGGAGRKKMREVNEEGTANLVNVCLNRAGIRFCHVSSIATISNPDHGETLNETVFWKSSGKESAYAHSKYNAEREVWRAMEEGLKAVIVNPGVIMAPAFWSQSSSKLLHVAYKGNRFFTRGSTAYVMAQDVAAVMYQLMKREVFGKRFLVFENNYTYAEIFGELRKGFGYNGALIALPMGVLRIASFFERSLSFFIGREAVLSPSLVKAAFNQQLYSNEELRKTLPYEFQPVKKNLARLCEIYQNELRGRGART